MAGTIIAPASAQSTMFLSAGRLIGVSRGTMTRRRCSFSMTAAARSTRLRDKPCAMPASVFIEQGTMAIAEQLWLPLAIVAPRSRLLWTVSAPALTLSPYFEDRYGTSLSSVASSPSSSRSKRRPKSDTTSSTWTPRAISSDSVLTAYSAPLAPVIANATLAADIDGHSEDGEIENADVAVEIERAFHLREIVGAHERV